MPGLETLLFGKIISVAINIGFKVFSVAVSAGLVVIIFKGMVSVTVLVIIILKNMVFKLYKGIAFAYKSFRDSYRCF